MTKTSRAVFCIAAIAIMACRGAVASEPTKTEKMTEELYTLVYALGTERESVFIEFLRKNKAHIDPRLPLRGQSLLNLAAKRGHILLFVELADIDPEKGIDIVDNEGYTPFLYFSYSRSTYWMEQVLKHKPNVSYANSKTKMNAVDYAAKTPHNEEMRRFLKQLLDKQAKSAEPPK